MKPRDGKKYRSNQVLIIRADLSKRKTRLSFCVTMKWFKIKINKGDSKFKIQALDIQFFLSSNRKRKFLPKKNGKEIFCPKNVDQIKFCQKKNNLLQKYFGLKKQQNLTKATVVYVKPQGTTFDEMPQLVSKYCYSSTIAICRQALRQRDILAI